MERREVSTKKTLHAVFQSWTLIQCVLSGVLRFHVREHTLVYSLICNTQAVMQVLFNVTVMTPSVPHHLQEVKLSRCSLIRHGRTLLVGHFVWII